MKMNFKTMTKKEKWMMFFLIGALIAVLLVPMEEKEAEEAILENEIDQQTELYKNDNNIADYEDKLSKRLIEILQKIDGAGKVDAWVRVSEGKELVLSMENTKDASVLKEQDSAGGTRAEDKKTETSTVILDKNGNPYVVKTIEPQIEGVFVVAEGAGNSTVKKNITEAVEVLFDIEPHRIKVAKKKLEE